MNRFFHNTVGKWVFALAGAVTLLARGGAHAATPAVPPLATGISPVDRVKLFAGTSNSRWMVFPGPTLPMGMVKLSPDNQGNVWNGGYEYTVASVFGFSFLHNMAMRSFSLMPTVGAMGGDPSTSSFQVGSSDGPFVGMWTAGYRSRIDKATEAASPGYYGVDLVDYRVKAELSTTLRTGSLRFTYPASDQSHLLIDFDPPAEEATRTIRFTLEQVSPTGFQGEMKQENNYAGTYTLYFALETSVPVAGVRIWQNGAYTGSDTNYGTAWRRPCKVTPLEKSFTGQGDCGAVLDFKTTQGEQVQARVGLSMVSVENAGLNLSTEAAPFGWDFDAEVSAARAAWARKLSIVDVSTERPDRAATFYTDLYRVYSAKAMLDDVNGQYRDSAGAVAQLRPPADHVYSSDAAWGWQWTQGPMWTTLDPATAVSVGNGLLALADRGGWIPAAPVNLRYSPIMGAQHQDALIVAACQKNLGVDPGRAYAAIKHDLTNTGVAIDEHQYAGNRHYDSYNGRGFVADEVGPQSNTFEYAYDDWCAGQLATTLGKTDDAKFFLDRSGHWRNAIDPAVKSARRRHEDGSWVTPFDRALFGTVGGWNGPGFMEGTAETYTYFVPQDVKGLIDLIGVDEFNRRLQGDFDAGIVDMGNEPSLQQPFLFNYSGKPWLTQRYVRKVLNENYDTTPYRGWAGEEDEGQMSAWYVLVSLGLFEVDGGCAARPAYDLTSPLFRKATLHLSSPRYGPRDLVIDAEGPADATDVRTVSMNGKELSGMKLPHDELVQGGRLHFVLTDAAPAAATGGSSK